MTRNRVNHFLIFCSIVLSYLYLPMQICNARLITVEFTAEVTEVYDNIFEEEVNIGDIITGTYTYDISMPDMYPERTTEALYEFTSPPSGIVIQIGGFTIQTDPNNVEFTIEIMKALGAGGQPIDKLEIYSLQNIMIGSEILPDIISIHLENTTSSYPMIGNLSDTLPACTPTLSDWMEKDIEFSGSTGSDRYGNGKGFSIKARLISATLISDPPKVIYVDDDAAGSNDGSSWENAYTFLQDAITDANDSNKPVEIRVAQGIYQPDMGTGIIPGDREATFNLMSQVAIKGGYSGLSKINPDLQNARLYKTILTGDLNSDDVPGFANRSDNSYHVLSAINADESAYIEGLFITGGNADGLPANNPNPTQRSNDHTVCGGGIYINNGHPVIANCIFMSNSAYEYGGGIYIIRSHPRINNCTFTGNTAGYASAITVCRNDELIQSSVVLKECLLQGNSASLGATLFISYSPLRLINCTLVDNRIYQESLSWSGYSSLICINSIAREVEQLPLYSQNIYYSNVVGGNELILNHSNIDKDPLFAAPGYWDDNGTPEDINDDYWIEGDYHLKSQAGRWNPDTQSWVQDDATSPCIDTGNPDSPIGLEPFPNGGYINMGAYGGTSEASKSYFGKPLCETIVAGDINGDCKVDELDMEIMLLHWLENNNP